MSLEEIYRKSDAYSVGRMFYNLLCPQNDSFLQPTITPFYNDAKEFPRLPSVFPQGLSYVLQQLVKHEPVDRMTDRKAMLT